MSCDRKSTNDDNAVFFDRAIETLEAYTRKVKKLRNEFALVKKQDLQPSVDSRPPAGVRGSVVDTSMIQWRQTLRPYC